MAEPCAIAPIGPSPEAILSAFGVGRKGAALVTVRTISATVAGGIEASHLPKSLAAAAVIPCERRSVQAGDQRERQDSVTTPFHPFVPEDRKRAGPVCLIEMSSE
jgi:hypothetical protein